MSTPKEWRNVHKGHRLWRMKDGLKIGEATLHDSGRSKATVKYDRGAKYEMTYEELYSRYRPVQVR